MSLFKEKGIAEKKRRGGATRVFASPKEQANYIFFKILIENSKSFFYVIYKI